MRLDTNEIRSTKLIQPSRLDSDVTVEGCSSLHFSPFLFLKPTTRSRGGAAPSNGSTQSADAFGFTACFR